MKRSIWIPLLLAMPASAAPIDDAIEQVVNANLAAAKSQTKIDALNDETNELLGRYRAVLEETQSMRVYNGQLDTLVASQQEEIASLREQIDNVTTIARELTPLMVRMLESLEAFVELDVPFLLDERRERVANLKKLMRRADVANSEKYRRLIEAYQIENEYGRTIEAYQGTLGEEGRTVNFLRLGRVVLIYQTIDEKEMGVWDNQSRSYEQLPGTYRTAIRKGLRIARRQAAPDLIRLPVAAPRSAP